MKLISKPHTIEAFQFLGNKTKAPKWFQDAYKSGCVYITIDGDHQYVTVFNGSDSMKAYLTDWVCISPSGVMFVLSDDDIKDQFNACD